MIRIQILKIIQTSHCSGPGYKILCQYKGSVALHPTALYGYLYGIYPAEKLLFGLEVDVWMCVSYGFDCALQGAEIYVSGFIHMRKYIFVGKDICHAIT